MNPSRWLLLRGLAREQRHWGEFRQALEGQGAQVLCLDLPGAGTERGRKSPASIPAIAEDVRRRWLALRGEERWGVCAISLGGMVAMQWCAAHPEDFGAVVLVNTSAGNLSPPWQRMRWTAVPQVLRALVSRDPAAREERILRITTRMRGGLAAVAREWAALPSMDRGNVLRQLAAAIRFRAPAPLRPPTLVVSAAQDPLTHPQCARVLAQHLRAELSVHPQAGHDLPLDDPQWVVEQAVLLAATTR